EARFLTDGRRQHHDLGADARAIVELDDVLVGHSNAARGNALADGPRLVGAVDPVKGVLVALPKIQGAGAERILRTARHAEAAAQLVHRRSALGLAREDFFGRIPVRPFLLAVHGRHAGPAESFAADAHAVAQGASALLYLVKEVIGRIDDDGAGLLPRIVLDRLTQVRRVDGGRTAGAAGETRGSADRGDARDEVTAAH